MSHDLSSMCRTNALNKCSEATRPMDDLKRRDLYHACKNVNVCMCAYMYVKMLHLYVNPCRFLCVCVGMSVRVRPCPLYYAVVAPWPRSVTGH